MQDDSLTPRFDRRQLLAGATAAGMATTLGPLATPSTAGAAASAPAKVSPSDFIRRENEREGTTDWQLTYTRIDPATKYRSPAIEGFVSHASIAAGESLELFVSTRPAGRFTLDIYRMGYYGGHGARHMQSIGPLNGVEQPDPPEQSERLRECKWTSSAKIPIPADWPSGVYLGKLSLVDARWQSYVIFIVRDARPAHVLFQCSDNTWQAYNRWPDNYSLYDNGKSSWALGGGVRVSYDRPYGKYCQILDAPLSQGSGEFLLWEFPLAYWLEREGYDVTYCSNTDVHRSADTLLRAKCFLSVGHDEYWSIEQHNHVRQAIDAGVSAAFLSGNSCCWVTPLTPSGAGTSARVMTRAGRYGGLTEAEKKIAGPFSMEGPNEALLMGARTVNPFNGSGDWIVTQPEHWLLEGTGLKKGDLIPGLVGWEFHGDPAKIPGLEIIAEGDTWNSDGQKSHYTATCYPGPKGNWVFNAATIWWAQGLSTPPAHMLPYSHFGRPHGPDPRVERITKNFLARA